MTDSAKPDSLRRICPRPTLTIHYRSRMDCSEIKAGLPWLEGISLYLREEQVFGWLYSPSLTYHSYLIKFNSLLKNLYFLL
jgi:hypothetical protein